MSSQQIPSAHVAELHSETSNTVAESKPVSPSHSDRKVNSPEKPTHSDSFTCGGGDHILEDCANKHSHSPTSLVCFECGGRGHTACECVSKSRYKNPVESSQAIPAAKIVIDTVRKWLQVKDNWRHINNAVRKWLEVKDNWRHINHTVIKWLQVKDNWRHKNINKRQRASVIILYP